MSVETLQLSQPLAPVRGLVPLHNAKGRPYRLTDVHRWLRLNRFVYKTDKVDLLAYGPLPDRLDTLIMGYSIESWGAMPVHMQASLRVDCATPPPDLIPFKKARLLDVFLCPRSMDVPEFEAWMRACRNADVPVRVQLQPPFPPDFDADATAQRLAEAGVKAVNVVLFDPFRPDDRRLGLKAVAAMNGLARALAERGVEANLFGLPLCRVDDDLRLHAGNRQKFFLDHQQYNKRSYELAEKLYHRPVHVAGLAVAALLGRHTAFRSPIDEFLLEWLVERQKRYHRYALLLRKLTRHLRIFPGTPKPLPEGADDPGKRMAELREKALQDMGPECARCSLRRICDHVTPEFRRHLPGLSVAAQAGEVVPSPYVFSAGQPKYFDPVDEARRHLTETEMALAKEANDLISNRAADKTFGFHDYLSENSYHIRMPGAVRWYSVEDTEVLSTIWHWGDTPLTVSVVFGGGIADYVGFAIGKAIRLVCPMVAYTHRLVLHVAADGRYVLLRDGVPVRPAEFEGKYYVPLRLPSAFPLQFSMFNINEHVNTQNLLLWEGNKTAEADRSKVKYTIIIVSTKYARRLQAVLRSVAHQEGVDLSEIEVIVGYVPGVDPTDDLINSMQLAHPGLRILRSTFPEQKTNAKGLIINESVNMAAGEWVVLLDSDIVLPPNFFAELAKVDEKANFVAPAGRKMLTRETTAQILLGEVAPWRQWQAIVDGPGEGRFGENREGGHLPVGFCQCVRTTCLKEIPYNEYDHFEGADWEFAIEMDRRYGPCAWLDVPVLHLDHGGSQWYGTQMQQ